MSGKRRSNISATTAVEGENLQRSQPRQTGGGNRLGIIAGLEATRLAVVERRRDRLVAVGREAVGQLADMSGDAEDLLDQHQAAPPRVQRPGVVGAESETVLAAGQRDRL